ncbi:hypothetical protein LIL_12254 [Leptospira interrogans serovar Linhai str. 56609]|nr:hypothetical protein LIL_12254 [Leptospira interrogans serovar Linhai str. 56609]
MQVLQLNLEMWKLTQFAGFTVKFKMWELTQFAGFTVKFRNVGTHTICRFYS